MRTEGFTNAEFGNSNVWFPNSSTGCAAATGCRPCRPAASGRRPRRPAASGCRPCRPKNPAASIYGGWVRVLSGGSKWPSAPPTGSAAPQSARNLRIRRLRPLQFMAADSRRLNPRQQVAVGTADRQQVAVGPADRSILSMKRATSCMAARAVWAYNGGTGSGKGFRTRRQLERSPFFVWNLIR